MANIIKVKPWGIPNGEVQEYPGNFDADTRLRRIKVAYDDKAIISIECFYEMNGAELPPHRWGGEGGEVDEVVFNDDEVTSIAGSYDLYNGVAVVKCLKFRYGEVYKGFGWRGENDFSVSLSSGSIVGFHGSSGAYLHSIGPYLKQEVILGPNGIELVLPIITEVWGAAEVEKEDNSSLPINASTRLTRIRPRSEVVVDSFMYAIKTDGVPYESNPMGGNGGAIKEVILKHGEYLTSIKGSYNFHDDKRVPAITSLQFTSNVNRRIGPFGVENGASFSFSVTNGQIVGFHGRFSSHLTAIGVMVTAAPTYTMLNQIMFFGKNKWKFIAGGVVTFVLSLAGFLELAIIEKLFK